MIHFFITHRSVVAVAVALITLFGVISIKLLPVQLLPDINRPELSIETRWRGAAPAEVESEISEPLENVLQGLPGLKELSSRSDSGRSEVELEFALGTDMQKTMMEVISRLNRVNNLPDNLSGPSVRLGGRNDNLTWFFVQKLAQTEGKIEDYKPLIETAVKPRLESIEGVSGVNVHSRSEDQLKIIFEPYQAAQLGIQLSELAGRIIGSRDVSAGSVDIGRREFKLRFGGKYKVDELGQMVITWREGKPVYLRDIARIEVTPGKVRSLQVQNGNPAIAIQILREAEANALETLLTVKETVTELNDSVLQRAGLRMEQSFDASVFIKRALNMVGGNLLFGIILAVGILWLFLRRWRAVGLIALAIPLCLLLTVIVLKATGRTINVISLAGMAFAVGLVLDAAIVVLENIVRQRENNHIDPVTAAATGTSQVWGALFTSTATTVAIFLPILLLNDVEGQLFADLALTIAVAVTISLVVAVTVLPTAAAHWLKETRLKDRQQWLWQKVTRFTIRLTDRASRRWLIILGLIGLPTLLTLNIPKMDYLPDVKRDAVDMWLNFTPGISASTVRDEVMSTVVERLAPYMRGEREPALKNYYFLLRPNNASIGIRAKDQSKVKELEKLVKDEIVADLPDTRSWGRQGSLFGGMGSNSRISLHLQSADLEALYSTANKAMALIRERLPDSQNWADPGLKFTAPELRVIPNDRRLAEVGLHRNDLPRIVQSLGEGRYLGEYFDGKERMDIILKGHEWHSQEQLSAIPLATPNGGVVPLGEMVDLDYKLGPKSIKRVAKRRSLTLNVSPPDEMTLQSAMDIIEQELLPQIEALMPQDGQIQLSGNADSLKKAIANMFYIFLFALLILLVLLWGLFGRVRDALLILITLPLATSGGLLTLQLLNTFVRQPLDLLTLIGFVILLGLVVNNAILLVHQARRGEAEGLGRAAAVEQALMTRMRPIFMSTLTSLFGMLPLLINPAIGSEIYRGMAAVIVGGMAFSTLFTLILLPALMRLGEKSQMEATP